MKKPLYIFILLLLSYSARGQKILDTYVQQGLQENIVLKGKYFSYQQSLQSLEEARGLFFPDVSLQARYTVADGGRVIEFPIGDLLHPVYSTLNMLTASKQFTPLIENSGNQEFMFYRPTEHETKLELVQPIFNKRIYHNRKIKENLVHAAKADMEAYKRELVKEIKTAYFQYLQARETVDLLNNTLALVEENIRVNKRLHENNLITRENIYQAVANKEEVVQQLAGAEATKKTSRAYFNFLLNKDLNAEVQVDQNIMLHDYTAIPKGAVDQPHREELEMVEYSINAAGEKIKLDNASRVPNLMAVVDYGFQGEEYRFTGDDDFLLASLVLRWNIFQGFQNKAKVQQGYLEKKKAELRYEGLQKRIDLEIIESYNNLLASVKKITAAREQFKAAKEAHRLVNKKYREGMASQLELINARTNMTNASENLIIQKYMYFIEYAAYERSAGLYNLDKKEGNTLPKN
jgi:outer membrane protein TolC